MKTKLTMALVLAALAAMAGVTLAAGTVTICYKRPGATQAQTYVVSSALAPSYLAHGATLGACPQSPSQ